MENMLKRALMLVHMMMNLKMKVTCLGLGLPLRDLLKHLSMENYLSLGGYPCFQVAYEIVLLGGTTTSDNFSMWHFWPNRFLAFQDHKLKQKDV